jgi:hypothetical protein
MGLRMFRICLKRLVSDPAIMHQFISAPSEKHVYEVLMRANPPCRGACFGEFHACLMVALNSLLRSSGRAS